MKKKQAPIFAIQSHLIKRFKPGYWASLSAGFGSGGKSIINNQSREDRRVNLLGAISVGFPLDKNQGAKITYLRNQALESIGADVNSFIIGWSYMIN